MLRYLGLVLVLFSWIVIAFIVTKWRGTKAMSISQHAATSRQASLLLAGLLSGAGILFYYWLVAWFAPKLGLGKLFTVLLTLAFIGQFVAGIVAEVEGTKRRIHRTAAYTMAYLFIPLSLLIIVAPHASTVARYFGAVCLAYLVISALSFHMLKKLKNHYLILQVIYIVAFQAQILMTAYTAH